MPFFKLVAWLHWDPPKDAFTLPFIDISIKWYGIIFALGFVLGYFILMPIYRKTLVDRCSFQGTEDELRKASTLFAERITWFIVLGTVLGARLGHVFFYEWPYYAAHPLEIFMIRNGGLASHGGTLGVILSLFFFLRFQKGRFPKMNIVSLIDLLVIPTAVAVCFIRIANFFNQEILGYETTLPWGIIFAHPADGSHLVPRHPVQLYEAASYLATFFILYFLWKVKGDKLKPGTLGGLFFILVFGSRFFLEFFKTEQTSWLTESSLQMGQFLSIPFILLGCFLLIFPKKQDPKTNDLIAS